jgi:hypothetical protein
MKGTAEGKVGYQREESAGYSLSPLRAGRRRPKGSAIMPALPPEADINRYGVECPQLFHNGHSIGPLLPEAGICLTGSATPIIGSPITKNYMRNLLTLGSSFQFASVPPGSI